MGSALDAGDFSSTAPKPDRVAADAYQRLFTGWSPVVLLLIVVLLLLILPPLYYLLKTSVYTTEPDGSFGEFTFSYYSELLSSPHF